MKIMWFMDLVMVFVLRFTLMKILNLLKIQASTLLGMLNIVMINILAILQCIARYGK